MKRQSSSQAIDTSHYDEHIIRMMYESENCLCCGIKLRYLLNKNKTRNRGYCSLECYYKLPPKLAYASREYGMEPKALIVKLLNGHTAEATAGLLGVGRSQLYGYIEKFGIKKKIIYI